jgi:hypothetical protein
MQYVTQSCRKKQCLSTTQQQYPSTIQQLESSCVVVALIENYSTSKPLNVFTEKSLILVVTLLSRMSECTRKLVVKNDRDLRLANPFVFFIFWPILGLTF